MASKLQERLAGKTANIERPPSGAIAESQESARMVTMPATLGAFRIEAQRYQSIIDDLNARLEKSQQDQALVADLQSQLKQAIESLAIAKLNFDSAEHGVKKLPLNLIDDSPYQPRMVYDQEEIDNLGHMMVAAGQEDKIVVRPKPNGRYELIKGHRRTRAARSLGWEEIDAEILIKDDSSAKLSAMISNEGQVGLTDYERGKLYHVAMADGYAKNQTELAHLFGTTQGHISLRMSMLKLPDSYVAMLERNPAMFGAKCAGIIAQLLKEYPGEAKLIEQAVARLNDGADQNSVKPWVQQMIKAKEKGDVDQSKDNAVITDKAGRPIFTAKFSGREFTIRIKASEVDAKEVEEMVLAALRQRAEQHSNAIIES